MIHLKLKLRKTGTLEKWPPQDFCCAENLIFLAVTSAFRLDNLLTPESANVIRSLTVTYLRAAVLALNRNIYMYIYIYIYTAHTLYISHLHFKSALSHLPHSKVRQHGGPANRALGPLAHCGTPLA